MNWNDHPTSRVEQLEKKCEISTQAPPMLSDPALPVVAPHWAQWYQTLLTIA